MNGAEAMLRAAASAGVDVCFANPGTTEMHLVAALDRVPEIRPVLGLFEGVVTGAADGYGRMTGRPAITILHLGPGLGNGIANLHNARRAFTPIVNLVGDHASWHLSADAPLTSDIEALASAVGRVHTVSTANGAAEDMHGAIWFVLGPSVGPFTLVVPQDHTWDEVTEPVPEWRQPTPPTPDTATVAEVVAALRRDGVVLVLGGDGVQRSGLEAAARVQAVTGCAVLTETFSARAERGAGLPAFDSIPYFPEQGAQVLEAFTTCVLAGAAEPVAFFGYPDRSSRLLPADCAVMTLARNGWPAATSLAAVADALDAGPFRARAAATRPEVPAGGELTTGSLGQTLAALQPDDAIVVNEAATSGLPWMIHATDAPPHDVLALTGGAIGMGLPASIGAAVACPDRPVIAFQADGSGLYTVQALWTMVRESLDITVVVCANRAYRILQYELARSGVTEPGPGVVGLMDLQRPTIDWVSLGRGFGMPSVQVDRVETLAAELTTAFAEPGPHLIEAVL